jgi:hypothetical protein
MGVRACELPLTPDRLMELLEKKARDDRAAAGSDRGAA